MLFHITASPGWSSLPLSGLYVDMLKRLLALSAGTPARELAGLTSLPPVSLLDGFGHADAAARRTSRPSPARISSHTRVSPQHPPGLYGAHDVESALNVMRADDRLSPLTDSGLQAYGNAHARALEPYLLAAAMLLLLLDALLSLWLRGFTPAQAALAALRPRSLLFAAACFRAAGARRRRHEHEGGAGYAPCLCEDRPCRCGFQSARRA